MHMFVFLYLGYILTSHMIELIEFMHVRFVFIHCLYNNDQYINMINT